MWMLFPDPKGPIPGRDWYLVPHDKLFAWWERDHGRGPGWSETQAWSVPYVKPALAKFLKRHKVTLNQGN